MKTITLSGGVEMPLVGYGTYLLAPDDCRRCVAQAIATGYRAIDTAQAYYNEEAVGRAVAESNVPRNELFITTKVWISNAGDRAAALSIDESLRKLGTDYVDLLLIHQPFADYYGTYRAMQQALRQGKARAIGLSNFYDARFVDLAENMEVKPAVVQLETHVFTQQKAMRALAATYGTHIMAWSPLARGMNRHLRHAHHGMEPPGPRHERPLHQRNAHRHRLCPRQRRGRRLPEIPHRRGHSRHPAVGAPRAHGQQPRPRQL